MSDHKKSPLTKNPKQSPVNHSYPFDSDNESDNKNTSRRISSEPPLVAPKLGTNPFDDNEVKQTTSSFINRYKNDFRDSGGLENQTVDELEDYAVCKAEETTKTVNSCLKIAEEMREDASKTLITLHQQGEQITRMHNAAADIDYDLSRGEKLLGNLGGIFSKTWKPKKTRQITGPIIIRDDPAYRNAAHLEQREKLGLSTAPRERSRSKALPPEPTNALQKVEFEKAKQDDGLSDLSNLLTELKGMALDMGSEIDSQNMAVGHLQDDVEELSFRVRGANARGRRLLGK